MEGADNVALCTNPALLRLREPSRSRHLTEAGAERFGARLGTGLVAPLRTLFCNRQMLSPLPTLRDPEQLARSCTQRKEEATCRARCARAHAEQVA